MRIILLILCLIASSMSQNWKNSQYLCVEVDNVRDLITNALIPAIQFMIANSDSNEKKDFISVSEWARKLQSNYNAYHNGIITPKSKHMTTLYGGGNYDTSNPAYLDFKPGMEVDLHIKAIAFSPNKIVAALVDSLAVSDNNFKHITLGTTNPYKPKNSNDLFENIFGDGLSYVNENFAKYRGTLQKTEDEEFEKVYLWIFQTPIEIKGIYKAK